MKKRLPRLYAPFIKQGKRWIRATYTMTNAGIQETREFGAYKKDTAVRIYQNWLLESALGHIDQERQLRPIPVNDKEYDLHPETFDK